MGLLTDPKSRERLVSVVSKHNNKLCVLCYVVGVAWFLALAYQPINAGTYFSENALLPGLVESHFHHDFGASEYLRNLKDEIKRIKTENKENAHKIPMDWLESEMLKLGLDVYRQNFSYSYPAAILNEQIFFGENIYGILRAPRAASTEALVLSVPYRPPEENQKDKTNGGIALMLALAKAFRKHSYWAKDIILLITGHETIGMQAWLSAYHHTPHQFIKAGQLHGRSGSIQAAINLEIATDSISKFSLKLEGLNGQLPNLDLVNTVVRLCKRERVTPTLYKKLDTWHPESWEGYQQSLKTMGHMMWQQASGSPSGNHGLFHRFNIEAVTMHGIKTKGVRSSASFTDMGRVLEGVFRSLNNLLERFHQSFFFYLLPGTERYISIGLYMPPFGVMALPIIIKALALWIHYTFSEEDSKEEKPAEKKEEGTEGVGASKEKDEKEQKKSKVDKSKEKTQSKDEEKTESTAEEKKAPRRRGDVMLVLPWIIMSMVFGLACNHGPRFVIATSQPFRMPPGEGLAWGALALMVSSMIFPRLLQRKARQKGDVHGPNPYLLKCVSLLTLGAILGGLGVVNISLAVFITAVWVPVLLIVWPRTSRIAAWLQYLLLLAMSPMGLVYMSNLLRHSVEPWAGPVELHLEAWASTQSALLYGVVDGHMIGSWTFILFAHALFPIWLMFWSLQYADKLPHKVKTS